LTVRIALVLVLYVAVALTLPACRDSKPAASAAPAGQADPAKETEAATEAELPSSEIETRLPASVRESLLKPFTGDLDEMVKRRLVRVGVTYNRTFYFVDKGVQRGVSYEYGQLVEARLNARFKTDNSNKIHVFYVPLPREALLSALIEGRVDLVAAQVTVRPEHQKFVDFTDPTRTNVSQILVTGPGAPAIASVADLAGKEVMARANSAYHPSLLALNEKFTAQGKPPMLIRTSPENLEDDDLLEMVNAGLIPAIVVDDYLAKFWKKVFVDLTVHEGVAVRTGGALAVPIRKNSPQLAAALNTFMGKYGLGTAFGNQIERRYLVSTKYLKTAASEAERKKFQALVALFRKYGERYKLDYLLMAAQGYQESQLDQNAKSEVGAIGVMQVMPATGAELKVGDIRKAEANIHAGIKYMRLTEDAFFNDEAIDDLNKALLTFASYNAGPSRVRQLRREAAKRGLNPNVWFGNVEQIASERIGRETVTYVANIYKYYIAYRLAVEESERRAGLKSTLRAKED
jgi:membrane-bound lytic murein transglycosylase MltF